MGVPEMDALWKRLLKAAEEDTLSTKDRELAEKLGKALTHLARDPRHPGLQSHEIKPLTERYGTKVYQSYLENRTPSAGRLFWVYGPEKGQICVVGLEPHPNPSQRSAYDRIKLSALPPNSAPAAPVKPSSAKKGGRRGRK